MATEIRIPDIGDVDSVEVIELCVAEGDVVTADDPLLVVESDKASMEVPAGAEGTVVRFTVAVGDEVSEGDVIAELESETDADPGDSDSDADADTGSDTAADAEADDDTEADTDADTDADRSESAASATAERDSDAASKEKDSAKEKEKTKEEEKGKEKGKEKAKRKEQEKEESGPGTAAPAARSEVTSSEAAGSEVYASPSIRRLAREFGVDLAAVSGTGEKGRILREDVQSFVKQGLEGDASVAGGGIPPLPVVDFAKFGETELMPLGRTRAAGAANLHRAWLNLPHVTNHDEADLTDLEDFRKSLKAQAEQKGIKVTPLAFIIKACTVLLKEFPTVNASLDAEVKNYILKRYVNVGIAVDTPQGLVVPVIADADKKGIWALSAEILDLAERARERKLKPAEMQGGTFSVSSLGAIGGTGFTPIINAPEVAILGVGRMAVRPQWDGAAFQPRRMLPLSLSYDHRAINGAEAGAFLARLRELLGDFRQVAL